jgi:hypothetical protein
MIILCALFGSGSALVWRWPVAAAVATTARRLVRREAAVPQATLAGMLRVGRARLLGMQGAEETREARAAADRAVC